MYLVLDNKFTTTTTNIRHHPGRKTLSSSVGAATVLNHSFTEGQEFHNLTSNELYICAISDAMFSFLASNKQKCCASPIFSQSQSQYMEIEGGNDHHHSLLLLVYRAPSGAKNVK